MDEGKYLRILDIVRFVFFFYVNMLVCVDGWVWVKFVRLIIYVLKYIVS